MLKNTFFLKVPVVKDGVVPLPSNSSVLGSGQQSKAEEQRLSQHRRYSAPHMSNSGSLDENGEVDPLLDERLTHATPISRRYDYEDSHLSSSAKPVQPSLTRVRTVVSFQIFQQILKSSSFVSFFDYLHSCRT